MIILLIFYHVGNLGSQPEDLYNVFNMTDLLDPVYWEGKGSGETDLCVS